MIDETGLIVFWKDDTHVSLAKLVCDLPAGGFVWGWNKFSMEVIRKAGTTE